MAKTVSVAGIVDSRSSGILRDYVHSHEPCAPGAAAHAKRRMYEYNSLLNGVPNGGDHGNNYPGGCGCSELLAGYRATYGGGYGGSFGGAYGESVDGTRRPYGPLTSDGRTGGGGGFRPPGAKLIGNAGMAPSEFMPNEDEEDYTKFDQTRDWLTCFGAVVIIACVLGIINSFAVFAPSMQHHYETGLIETVLVGCLCYAVLVAFLPVSTLILACLEHRWTALFGMLLVFNGLLIDAFTPDVAALWASHLLFIGLGGSLAYESAASICSDHFRKHLGLALCAVSCAGSLGTMLIYFLSNLMLSYISYLWTKLCLALLVLICMGACQTFPERSQHFPWSTDRNNKEKVKKCLQEYAKARSETAKKVGDEEGVSRKSLLCVCVCDVSVLTDFSFLLWAVLNLVAMIAIYVPYLFLEAYAVMLGTDYAISLIIWFCLASILARLAFMNSNDHTFGFNRTVFQVCCIASGILYIFLNWAETYGWILVWGLAMGAIEGILTSCIPRVTLQTVPLKWLSACWTWTILSHAVGLLIGPIVMMSVYYYVLEYGPALIAIGIVQILAGVLAFLLPNEEDSQPEELGDGGDKADTGITRNGNEAKGLGKGYTPGTGTGRYDGPNNRSTDPMSSYDSKPYDGYGSYGGNVGVLAAGSGTAAKSASPGPVEVDGANGEDNGLELPLGLTPAVQNCFDRPYTDDCPICSKIGGVPCCCDCTPAGLTRTHTYGGSSFGKPLPLSYGSAGYSNYLSYKPPGSAGCNDFMAEMNSYLEQLKNRPNHWASQGPGKTPTANDTSHKQNNRPPVLKNKDNADKNNQKSTSKDKNDKNKGPSDNKKGAPKKSDPQRQSKDSDKQNISSKEKKKSSSKNTNNDPSIPKPGSK